MGLFNKNKDLDKTEELPVIDLDKTQELPVIFESDDVVNLSVNGFLDTTDKLTIAKYKSNVTNLVKHTKDLGYIDHYCIIRNDNYLPLDDFTWRVNSKDTQFEYKNIGNLDYMLRFRIAEDRLKKETTNNNGFLIPPIKSEIDKEMENIPKGIGKLYLPTVFRSTKHFTLNTALGTTGNYNAVDANRDYTVIDNADNFLNSGYAYSIADHDCYLDVAHRGLPISEYATILISEEKYNDLLKNDPDKLNKLRKRKVVVFRGDIDTAVNMILTEKNVLPFHINYNVYEYDQDLFDIITSSIKDVAAHFDLYYDKSHAGSEGHFSSKLDDQYKDEYVKEFFNRFTNKFGPFKVELNELNFSKVFNEVIYNIDSNELLNFITEFNNEMKIREQSNKGNYLLDRAEITDEMSNSFVNTLKGIKEYYEHPEEYNFNELEKANINELIKMFFQADNLNEQLYCQDQIDKFWGVGREIRR